MSTGPFSKLRSKNAPKDKGEQGELNKTRRRLSVVSDNKLVEGLSGLQQGDSEVTGGAQKGWISSYAGVSKKGYAPYNPRKKNQDILIMQEHAETGSLLLAVFDGHGEAGDAVSQFFRKELPPTLFSHPRFIDTSEKGVEKSLQEALSESVAFLEKTC